MTLRLRVFGIEVFVLDLELPETPNEQPTPRPAHKRFAAWWAARELAILATGK